MISSRRCNDDAIEAILLYGVRPDAACNDGRSGKAIDNNQNLIPKQPTETELTIEGKKVEPPDSVKDGQRLIETPPLELGKTYAYKVSVVIIPNNYTKIFRNREITFKAGENVTLDMTKEDKATDKIEVRWVPTPDDIVDKMCELGKIQKTDVVYDFGCGDAVMLIRPIKTGKADKGVGIDIDPKMVAIAKEKVKEADLEKKIIIKQGDILDVKPQDCADATLVLLYIGDDLGARLGPVLQKSLKPGARIVSHRFTLGDWKPEKTIEVIGVDGDSYTLHLWTIPDPKKKTEPKKSGK
ncbi:MAG: class I SAM-dependent methyltransferase [Zavarzinella sp.]